MALNLINFIFVNFALVTLILGNLVNFLESYLPVIIIQTIRFGKISLENRQNILVQILEVPKEWYKHFYVFAMVWSLGGLFLSLQTLITGSQAPESIINFLNIVAGGSNRLILVDTTTGIIAITLLTLQCCRRFYETQYVQIFSSKGKINFSQYLVGYIHYFGAVIAVLANMDGFVPGSSPSRFSIQEVSFFQCLCIVLFLYSWYHQYQTNLILANLRKTKDGKVATERHLLPTGGYFEYVSSPHMMFEVLIYISLMGILSTSITWRYITFWVIANQTETAYLTHKWYKSHFDKYPKKRAAIYPFLL